MTSVAQRMNANGEARKRGGGMTRTFSPLTPIIQRLPQNKKGRETLKEVKIVAILYTTDLQNHTRLIGGRGY